MAENLETPKIIDNVSCRLGDDISGFLGADACVYVASSGFSLSAFEHLADELESVREMLNLRIHNPCIFRVTDEEGGPIETAIYPKVSGGVLYGDSAVFRYARRNPSIDERAQWPSGVTTLESLLIHLAAELAGMSVRPGEPLKLFDERHYAVESLRAELADVEKKLSKEKQLNRKYELAKSKQRVLAKLEAAK